MIPVKLHAGLNAGRSHGSSPVYCRKCGKRIKTTSGSSKYGNLIEVCRGCQRK